VFTYRQSVQGVGGGGDDDRAAVGNVGVGQLRVADEHAALDGVHLQPGGWGCGERWGGGGVLSWLTENKLRACSLGFWRMARACMRVCARWE